MCKLDPMLSLNIHYAFEPCNLLNKIIIQVERPYKTWGHLRYSNTFRFYRLNIPNFKHWIFKMHHGCIKKVMDFEAFGFWIRVLSLYIVTEEKTSVIRGQWTCIGGIVNSGPNPVNLTLGAWLQFLCSFYKTGKPSRETKHVWVQHTEQKHS